MTTLCWHTEAKFAISLKYCGRLQRS
jgi:hypothetical protein